MRYQWKKIQSDPQKQLLTWKYGQVIFTKSQPLQQNENLQSYEKTFLITTKPFQKHQKMQTLIIQSNEENKSLNSTEQIIQWFIKNKINRNSYIFIKGGGILLDLASFSASIYMRGIKYIYFIPTTLLAMVDATIGGKNGINYQNTKNLIGAIRNPKTIYIHLPYLYTQSKREFYNGMVQTIKMAATYDENFFNFLQQVDFQTLRLRQNQDTLQKIVKRSLQMKIQVVQKDLTQQNERKWLNFGHTIAHGIQLSQENTLLHGECVAIGMIKACQIAENKKIIKSLKYSIRQRIINILKKINMPTEVPQQINRQKMIETILRDKKKSNSSKQQIDFALIQKIGQKLQTTTKVSVNELKEVLMKKLTIKYPQNGIPCKISNFKFPSSKSISLRIIYMQCLNYLKNLNKSNLNMGNIIQNFLECQDTQKMVTSLIAVGFNFDWNKQSKWIKILNYNQKQTGQLDVGNSGITTRFILPLCFMLKGKWTINCHQRMSQRPNKQIIVLCLKDFQGSIQYLKKQFCFPLIVNSPGNTQGFQQLKVNGQESSQFVSSALINSAFFNQSSKIILTNQKIVSESYIKMTCQCLQKYQIKSKIDKQKLQINLQRNPIQNFILKESKDFSIIQIQKDLSTFSYPYIFNQFHQIQNQAIKDKYMQGDTQFYEYVKHLKQNLDKKSLQYDFNSCTDTFMTLAVFTCYHKIQQSSIQTIKIFNISNQRIKESNRIDLTIKNLKKVGVLVQQHQNYIIIHVKMIKDLIQSKIQFETAKDHRLVMSFAILSSYLSKIFPNKTFIIDDKKSVQKTFPLFWNYLQSTGIKINHHSQFDMIQQTKMQSRNFKSLNLQSMIKKVIQQSFILIGNRGSGKSTIAKKIAAERDCIFIDTDEITTLKIQEQFKLSSITQMVQKYGWNKFRQVQSHILQDVLINKRKFSQKPLIISTGGGILEKQINQLTLQRQNSNVIYIQRQFKDLKLQLSDHRPIIDNFQQISKKRQKIYQKVASLIINLSDPEHLDLQIPHVLNCLKKYHSKKNQLQQGYILCLDQVPQKLTEQQEEVKTFEFRMDKLLISQDKNQNYTDSLKLLRKKLSKFMMKYKKDFILTLRTKQQLGQFQNNRLNYLHTIKEITKIPNDFIDFQVSKYFNEVDQQLYNPNNIIFSYHGKSQQCVRKLIQISYGIKKFCYYNQNKLQPSINLYQKYKQQSSFKKGICIDLHNPLSRLDTKYQMVVKNIPKINKTGIMSLKQMKILKSIF